VGVGEDSSRVANHDKGLVMVTCPFCDDTFPRNCEYVDIGVGHQQVSANYCENCGAWEMGAFGPDGSVDQKDGWQRIKPADRILIDLRSSVVSFELR
jgi:hypothetical protein